MTSPRWPRTLAITGALGFVADRLIPHVLARGTRVLAVVRPGRDAQAIEREGVEIRRGDLDRPESLAETFAGAEGVVHLAGMSLVPRFLPALQRAGVRVGVFVSSAGVYTKLPSRPAEAKREGERALVGSGISWTVLRPSMIYGTPRDRNVIRLVRWIDRVPLIAAPLGGITPQQPVHVDDLVQAVLASLERDAAAEKIYDTGGADALPLREMIREVARALGRPVWVLPIPLAPAHAAAVIARRWKLPFPVKPEQVLRLTESKAVDITPAGADLGFKPRTFREGIVEEVRLHRLGAGRV